MVLLQPFLGYLDKHKLLSRNKVYLCNFADRKEAAPKFIIKPHSTTVVENSTVNLHAAILSTSDPIVTWYHNEVQLSQSVKHMQRYQGGLELSYLCS